MQKERSKSTKPRKESKIDNIKLDKETIISSLEESFSIDDAIKKTIDTRIASQISKVGKFSEKANKAFAKFIPSKVSSKIRKNITYLGHSGNLQTVQKTVIEQDLKQMADISKKKGISASLSGKDLSNFGLTKADDGTIIGTPQLATIGEYISESFKQMDLYARSDIHIDCKAKIDAEEIMNEITTEDNNSNSSSDTASSSSQESEENDATDLTLDQLVKDNVFLQMKHSTSPEANVNFGISDRANQKDIVEATKTFELRGGPADVTAYHDFYDLQIAFRHVWTELFDKQLARKGKYLFERLEKYKKEIGVDNIIDLVTGTPVDDDDESPKDDDSITSADQLKQLMEDIEDIDLQIAGEDYRFKDIKKMLPEITLEQWVDMDETTKDALFKNAIDYNNPNQAKFEFYPTGPEDAKKKAQTLLEEEEKKRQNKSSEKSNINSRIYHFLEDLKERLAEEYAFKVYVGDSVNYGILINYRQEWKPLNYQVGELVSTMPLAPKEVRKYSKKRVVKKSRAEKEIENSLQIRKEDSSDTHRDHAEIVRKAMNKTNFRHNSSGGVNFGVWNVKGSHSVALDSARHSSQIKKEFREAVLKSANEYKNERKLEINETESDQFEETTSGEISNPNDELPVTYLFYELQRCYEVSEKIHKLTPVIMVANEVPSPDEIDEDWLLAHDWILRRAILDDSFLTAIDYLSDGFVGDEISIKVLQNNLATQKGVVEKMTQQIVMHSKSLASTRSAMEYAISQHAGSLNEESGGLFSGVGDFLFGGDDDPTEMLRVKMEAAKEAFQRAERQDKESRSRMENEVTALESATDKYTSALQNQFNRRTEILRLRSHVKDNILYYMQAIWDQEPSDQRFFRLFDLEVTDINIAPDLSHVPVKDVIINTQGGKVPVKFKMNITSSPSSIKLKKLVEIADLENLIGYKGNYMIFPLKKNNGVTLFMMQDYMDINETARLWDPDESGNYTIDEMKELIKCYYKQNPDSFSEEVKKKYRDLFIKRLMDPCLDKNKVIVPTDSLYIEALPGKHPILEDFKLIHRAVDVKKVQSEVRHSELENVRLAARSLKGEYEDPDIEKKIVIEGGTDVNVSTDS